MPSNKRKPTALPNSDTGKRKKVRLEEELGNTTQCHYDQIHLGKSRVLADPGFLIKADVHSQGLPRELHEAQKVGSNSFPTNFTQSEAKGSAIQKGFNVMHAVGVGSHTLNPLTVGPMSKAMYLTLMQHDTDEVSEMFRELNLRLSNYETVFQQSVLHAYEHFGPEKIVELLKSAWLATRGRYSSRREERWLRPMQMQKKDKPISLDRTEQWIFSHPSGNLPSEQMPAGPMSDISHFIELFDQDLLPEGRLETRALVENAEGLRMGSLSFRRPLFKWWHVTLNT